MHPARRVDIAKTQAAFHALALWDAILEHLRKQSRCGCYLNVVDQAADDIRFVPAPDCEPGLVLADEFRIAAERCEQTARGGPRATNPRSES
jgi:hypothetical protein